MSENRLGKCENRSCNDDAVCCDDDGRMLCGDCYFEVVNEMLARERGMCSDEDAA